MHGSDEAHYTFDVKALTGGLPVIVAYGTSAAFGYHKAHAAGTLTLKPAAGPGIEDAAAGDWVEDLVRAPEAGPCALKCTAEALALNAKCSKACVASGQGLGCETECKMKVLAFDIPCLKACRKANGAAAGTTKVLKSYVHAALTPTGRFSAAADCGAGTAVPRYTKTIALDSCVVAAGTATIHKLTADGKGVIFHTWAAPKCYPNGPNDPPIAQWSTVPLGVAKCEAQLDFNTITKRNEPRNFCATYPGPCV